MNLIKSRLFVKFLLVLLGVSLAVVVLMVITMQFFVYRNFSDYVVQQELDGLDGLTAAFSAEFLKKNAWEDFRDDPRYWHEVMIRYASRDGMHRPPPTGAFNGQIPPPLSPLARRLSLFDADKRIVFGNPDKTGQVFRPIMEGERIIGWLGLKKEDYRMTPADISFLKQQSRAFYLIGAVVLIMAVGVSILFSRHLTDPVRRIAQATRAVRNRQFDRLIQVTTKDELGRLAEDFNTMVRTLKRYETMRRQWLSDIAHELRTPLAVLRGEIEALQDGIRTVDASTVDSLHGEVMALSGIVEDLSLITKTESGLIEMKHAPANPFEILRESLRRFGPRFREHGISVKERLPITNPPKVMGDADKLSRVFANILENTLRYTVSPGTLTITCRQRDNRVRISFEDSGPGVAEASLSRIFDRLYRTDAARTREKGGSGLGLSICKSIIEGHEGHIWAENVTTGGLRIVIELPLYNQPA